MKNKKTEILLVWLWAVTLCLLPLFCREVKADDAFIVEEKAIIGGESLGEDPSQRAAQPSAGQEQPLAQSQPPAEQEKPPAQSQPPSLKTTQDATSAAPPTLSQNSPASAFQVPVRRSDKYEEIAAEAGQGTSAEGEPKQQPAQEPDGGTGEETGAKTEPPSWLLVAGGVFLLGGCARILWRIKKRG